MKKSILLLLCLVTIFLSTLSAQTEEAFKPSGKPEVRVYSNFNSSFSDGKNSNQFEITRAYFGYGYNFSKTVSSRITFDVGNPGVGKFQMSALLKYAYLEYKKDKLTANFGLISTNEFEVQEKQWGYRYLYKSYQDEYGFGASADLGASVSYDFSKKVSADIMVANGEGYKSLDKDSALKVSVGVTYQPIGGFTVRGYYDNMTKSGNAQETYAGLVGFGNKQFNINAEYNYQTKNSIISGHDFSGFSLYGTAFLKNNMKIFARYDQLDIKKSIATGQPWNTSLPKSFYMAGFEFSPVKGVKIAPNLRGIESAVSGRPFTTEFYINLEFRI